MDSFGYLDKFKSLVTEKSVIAKDSDEGKVVQKIIDILCKHNLLAYEGIAILEKCAVEVICGSKIKKTLDIPEKVNFRKKQEIDNHILSEDYSKISIVDEMTEKEYAVITRQEVITASNVLVKLTLAEV